MSSAVHHDPVCMGIAPLSISATELIARYQGLPDTVKRTEGGGILAWALYHTRCIFAEHLYTVNVVVSDWKLLDRRVDKCYIIRYASDTLLKYCVSDYPSKIWLNIYAQELTYAQSATDPYMYIPTVSGFVKIVECLKGTFCLHPKRGMYVMEVSVLNWLLGHQNYYLAEYLLNAEYVLPNKHTLKFLWKNYYDLNTNNPTISLIQAVARAMNHVKLPEKFRDHYYSSLISEYHDSSRQDRTLQEIAILQCAKAGIPYTLPNVISWHLRQDIYTIEKYRRKISTVH